MSSCTRTCSWGFVSLNQYFPSKKSFFSRRTINLRAKFTYNASGHRVLSGDFNASASDISGSKNDARLHSAQHNRDVKRLQSHGIRIQADYSSGVAAVLGQPLGIQAPSPPFFPSPPSCREDTVLLFLSKWQSQQPPNSWRAFKFSWCLFTWAHVATNAARRLLSFSLSWTLESHKAHGHYPDNKPEERPYFRSTGASRSMNRNRRSWTEIRIDGRWGKRRVEGMAMEVGGGRWR